MELKKMIEVRNKKLICGQGQVLNITGVRKTIIILLGIVEFRTKHHYTQKFV